MTLATPAAAARPIPHPAEAAPARLVPTVLVLAPPALLASGQLYLGIPLVPSVAAEWGVPATAATSALTTYGFGYAVGVVLFGLLVSRLGARRVMTYGLLAFSVATVAVTFAHDVNAGYALRAVQGLAGGAFPPAAFAYVGATMAPRLRGTVLACLTGGFLGAGSLAQLAGQAAAQVSWRTAFLGGAALMVAAAVAVRSVLRPDPVRANASGNPRLKATPKLFALYSASFTLLVAFVSVYTALQASTVVDHAALPWLRLAALPAVLAMPFLIGRIPLPAPVRAAVGLALVAVVAVVTAVTGAGTPTAALAVLLFALTLGVALAAPSLAEAVGTTSGPARALGSGIFNACLLTGASVAGPVATGLSGLSTSAVLAAGVTAVGAGAAALAARARD